MRSHHFPSRRAGRRRAGFTLIELLVVIAIIAILAGIVLSVVGGMTGTAHSTKCAANLGQIGIAINAYCADHDNTLPGPLSEGQYARWTGDDTKAKGSLAKLLVKYLETTETKSAGRERGPESVMICPAWDRETKGDNEVPVYVMNFEDRLTDYNNQVPWGDVAEGSEPVRRAVLTSWRETNGGSLTRPNAAETMNLARVWAIKDADQDDFKNAQRKPAFVGKLPKEAVHSDHRNVLFYDFHVGKMKLDDTVQ